MKKVSLVALIVAIYAPEDKHIAHIPTFARAETDPQIIIPSKSLHAGLGLTFIEHLSHSMPQYEDMINADMTIRDKLQKIFGLATDEEIVAHDTDLIALHEEAIDTIATFAELYNDSYQNITYPQYALYRDYEAYLYRQYKTPHGLHIYFQDICNSFYILPAQAFCEKIFQYNLFSKYIENKTLISWTLARFTVLMTNLILVPYYTKVSDDKHMQDILLPFKQVIAIGMKVILNLSQAHLRGQEINNRIIPIAQSLNLTNDIALEDKHILDTFSENALIASILYLSIQLSFFGLENGLFDIILILADCMRRKVEDINILQIMLYSGQFSLHSLDNRLKYITDPESCKEYPSLYYPVYPYPQRNDLRYQAKQCISHSIPETQLTTEQYQAMHKALSESTFTEYLNTINLYLQNADICFIEYSKAIQKACLADDNPYVSFGEKLMTSFKYYFKYHDFGDFISHSHFNLKKKQALLEKVNNISECHLGLSRFYYCFLREIAIPEANHTSTQVLTLLQHLLHIGTTILTFLPPITYTSYADIDINQFISILTIRFIDTDYSLAVYSLSETQLLKRLIHMYKNFILYNIQDSFYDLIFILSDWIKSRARSIHYIEFATRIINDKVCLRICCADKYLVEIDQTNQDKAVAIEESEMKTISQAETSNITTEKNIFVSKQKLIDLITPTFIQQLETYKTDMSMIRDASQITDNNDNPYIANISKIFQGNQLYKTFYKTVFSDFSHLFHDNTLCDWTAVTDHMSMTDIWLYLDTIKDYAECSEVLRRFIKIFTYHLFSPKFNNVIMTQLLFIKQFILIGRNILIQVSKRYTNDLAQYNLPYVKLEINQQLSLDNNDPIHTLRIYQLLLYLIHIYKGLLCYNLNNVLFDIIYILKTCIEKEVSMVKTILIVNTEEILNTTQDTEIAVNTNKSYRAICIDTLDAEIALILAESSEQKRQDPLDYQQNAHKTFFIPADIVSYNEINTSQYYINIDTALNTIQFLDSNYYKTHVKAFVKEKILQQHFDNSLALYIRPMLSKINKGQAILVFSTIPEIQEQYHNAFVEYTYALLQFENNNIEKLRDTFDDIMHTFHEEQSLSSYRIFMHKASCLYEKDYATCRAAQFPSLFIEEDQIAVFEKMNNMTQNTINIMKLLHLFIHTTIIPYTFAMQDKTILNQKLFFIKPFIKIGMHIISHLYKDKMPFRQLQKIQSYIITFNNSIYDIHDQFSEDQHDQFSEDQLVTLLFDIYRHFIFLNIEKAFADMGFIIRDFIKKSIKNNKIDLSQILSILRFDMIDDDYRLICLDNIISNIA